MNKDTKKFLAYFGFALTAIGFLMSNTYKTLGISIAVIGISMFMFSIDVIGKVAQGKRQKDEEFNPDELIRDV